ncbi:MAG: peptidase E [Solirubrobacterales bacterium]|nr:peptidase E [Solirubrobacterales bacterium]MBV9716708.1 peptidase E [Solirubrobacterales bacterium]
MATRATQIVAFGGGGFSMEWGNTLLDDYVLGVTGVARPRVCFLPTASGDADHYVVRFYRAFSACRCEPSHLSLFRRETGVGDPRAHLLAQDLVYVGGGSIVSLLGTWRAHGVDSILREAWQSGVVMCGGSAGSLCWFAHAVSGFHAGPPRAVDAMGLLPFTNAVHYDEEPARREAVHRVVRAGGSTAYAAGDGAALHFVGAELADVVSSRPGSRAFVVSRDDSGLVSERALTVRYLGPDADAPVAPAMVAAAAVAA